MCFQPARSVPAASPLPPQGPWPPSTAEGNGPHPVPSLLAASGTATPPSPATCSSSPLQGRGHPSPPTSPPPPPQLCLHLLGLEAPQRLWPGHGVEVQPTIRAPAPTTSHGGAGLSLQARGRSPGGREAKAPLARGRGCTPSP